ncbi:MAG: 2-oxoglutarate and iron-dependent oxygenase domain-containing protein [Planctomycetota bacterium]
MSQEIPVLTLAELEGPDSDARDAKIRLAFGRYGMIYLRDHGIEAARLEALYARYLAWLARPPEEKERFGRGEIWYQRGWTPPNTEKAVVAQGQPDFKECWFAMVEPPDPALTAQYPELFAENLWPEGEDEFRTLFLEIGGRLQALGLSLLRACARALDLPAETFCELVRGGAHVTRALKYLPLDETAIARGILWGEEHTDFNLVTLLPGGRFQDAEGRPTAPPGDGSGLFLRTPPSADEPRGRLVSGSPPPGCLVAQVGQELEILSGGTFLATPHVITAPRRPGLSRTSLAHFVHVHPHRTLFPLEPFRSPEAVERYRPPVLAGTYATKTMADIGLAPPSVLSRFGYRHYDRLASFRAEEDARGGE